MNILITGANGVIGKFLSEFIKKNITNSIALIYHKKKTHKFNKNNNIYYLDICDKNLDWGIYLKDIDIVIHLASKQHIVSKKKTNHYADFYETNVESTLKLAKKCCDVGVKKFFFISSIKVNGEFTQKNNFFNNTDKPDPKDNYAISKMIAENKLKNLMKNCQMDIIILRLPLVYGTDPKGNLLSIKKIVEKKIPLPLVAFSDNIRSFLSIYNLSDFLFTAIQSKKKISGIFLISDDDDLSTYEFLNFFAKNINQKYYFFYLPKFFLKFVFCILGKNTYFDKLNKSLKIEIYDTKKMFNWTPKFTVKDSFNKMT